jgi:hypothetical protein
MVCCSSWSSGMGNSWCPWTLLFVGQTLQAHPPRPLVALRRGLPAGRCWLSPTLRVVCPLREQRDHANPLSVRDGQPWRPVGSAPVARAWAPAPQAPRRCGVTQHHTEGAMPISLGMLCPMPRLPEARGGGTSASGRPPTSPGWQLPPARAMLLAMHTPRHTEALCSTRMKWIRSWPSSAPGR